ARLRRGLLVAGRGLLVARLAVAGLAVAGLRIARLLLAGTAAEDEDTKTQADEAEGGTGRLSEHGGPPGSERVHACDGSQIGVLVLRRIVGARRRTSLARSTIRATAPHLVSLHVDLDRERPGAGLRHHLGHRGAGDRQR